MFIRNLLLVFVAYLLIQFIGKVWKFRKVILQQRDAILNQTKEAEKASRQEGEIHIKSKKSSSSKDMDEGTYIDYEEVD